VETALGIGLANAAVAALLAILMAGPALIWRKPALTHALVLLRLPRHRRMLIQPHRALMPRGVIERHPRGMRM
jgi:hypothetical protein